MKTSIDEHSVGRELDVLVAKKVMGWKQQSHRLWFDHQGHERWIDYPRPPYWSPSTDIVAAWQVAEKMATDGWRLKLEAKLSHRKEIRAYTVEFDKLVGDDLEQVGVREIKTAPLAICLAALKTVGMANLGDAWRTSLAEVKGKCQTGHNN